MVEHARGAHGAGAELAGLPSASPPQPGSSTFPAHVPHSEGKLPPELCKFPISVGGCSVRLEKELSILSDPSHDKIALLLQTSAPDWWLVYKTEAVRYTPTPFQKESEESGRPHSYNQIFWLKMPLVFAQKLLVPWNDRIEENSLKKISIFKFMQQLKREMYTESVWISVICMGQGWTGREEKVPILPPTYTDTEAKLWYSHNF